LPHIHEEQPYNGALECINRPGLTPLLDELRHILTGFPLHVYEEKNTNGGAVVRRMIDARFRTVPVGSSSPANALVLWHCTSSLEMGHFWLEPSDEGLWHGLGHS
jgi:hypothetical protein